MTEYDCKRGEEDEKEENKLTFTSDAAGVKVVSHGTFTAERAVRVNALAINTRIIDAFVNIYNWKDQHRVKLHAATVTEIQENYVSSLTRVPFGWSSFPCSYPTVEQRI